MTTASRPKSETEDSPAPLTQGWHVADGHEVYYETIGSPDGLPAVFLHGGPGSGCQPGHRALFDPALFQAVLIDQRGAGRSRPAGAREANTTQTLIADMEAIRAALGFEKWLVVGGSWGATLALAYAQRHPERVSGLVLRSVFLGTRAELDWAFGTALATFYPELYRDFLSLLPPEDRHDPLAAYWEHILRDDKIGRVPFIRAWHDVERVLSSHTPLSDRLDMQAIHNVDSPLPSTPEIESHFFSNGCFLTPTQLLDDTHRLAGVPGIVLQSRYDLLCPPATSSLLASRWRDAKVRIIGAAGHSMSESPVQKALAAAIVEATTWADP